MRQRFGSHGTGGVSFFGFQSVITGTVGFIIVLTLFLALCVKDIIPRDKADGHLHAKREGDLRSMQSQILSLKNLVADLQNRPADDEATLKRMIGQLTSTIATLQTPPTAGLDRDHAATARDRELREVRKKLLTKLDQMNASMHDAELLASGINKDIPDLEKKLKDAQSSLQRLRDRRNVISLVPEQTETKKEPVLVLVQGSLIRLQRANGTPAVAGSIPDFVSYLRGLSAATHYVVFYFKPSGANHFDSLTRRARQEGYEIGYDVIPEDMDVEFHNNTPAAKP